MPKISGDGDRWVASREQDKIHCEASGTTIAIGKGMDPGDAVVKISRALDRIDDFRKAGKKRGHEIGDLDGIGRNVIRASDANRRTAIRTRVAVIDPSEDDAMKAEKVVLGERSIGLSEFFNAIPSLGEIDGFQVILERLARNGDALGKDNLRFPQRQAVAFDRIGLIHHPHIPRRRETGDRSRCQRAQSREALMFGGE